MRWLIAKLASLVGTALAAVVGVLASQTLAFIHAYMQRLGGHIDEARHSLQMVQTGGTSGVLTDPAMRDKLAAAFHQRIGELQGAYDAIERANVFMKPVALLGHLDQDIATATAHVFTPALPLDTPSLVFALVGMAVAWMAWEVLRWPFAAMARRHRCYRRA